MGDVTIQFMGCGDAFGSGGRFQTCFLVQTEATRCLVDCGASSLIALRRFGVDPAGLDAILITHLHGDHFGGLPFVLLDAQHVTRRARPLVVAGPPGLAARTQAALEVFFPGSAATAWRFPLEFVELSERQTTPIGPLAVTAYPVAHPSGAPAYALRIATADKALAYSGDTAWTETLLEVAAGSDFFVCEAYTYDRPVKHHLAYQTLLAHRARLGCRRLIVTHLGPEMIDRLPSLELEAAEDGKRIVV